MKVLVVIPTYNNGFTISQVVKEVLETGIDVLVVNDGSTDKTSYELSRFSQINLISIPHNIGKGKALREAFNWAGNNNYTHLISVDADGQHNPADITRFIKVLKEEETSLIIGSRDFRSRWIPFSSRVGRAISNLAFRFITGISLTDTQSGFRAYPLKKIDISNKNKYDFEMDMIINAVFAGIHIREISISVHYSRFTQNTSKFKPILDSIRIARTIFLQLIKKKMKGSI